MKRDKETEAAILEFMRDETKKQSAYDARQGMGFSIGLIVKFAVHSGFSKEEWMGACEHLFDLAMKETLGG